VVGGQSDLTTARQRYLQLFWKTVAPPWMESYYGGYYGNTLPVEILENAIKHCSKLKRSLSCSLLSGFTVPSVR